MQLLDCHPKSVAAGWQNKVGPRFVPLHGSDLQIFGIERFGVNHGSRDMAENQKFTAGKAQIVAITGRPVGEHRPSVGEMPDELGFKRGDHSLLCKKPNLKVVEDH
jgi:hypothetical protein